MTTRLIGALAVLVLALAPVQTTPATAQEPQWCFEEVPDCIEGRFLEYWQQNGALITFGYPIGPARVEQVDGKSYLAQPFERNRLELHPEHEPPYDVLLGRLGADRLAQLGRPWQGLPQASSTSRDGCQYFAETGHLLCEQFLLYWYRHGLRLDERPGFRMEERLALFGLPISEASFERGEDGTPYMVQWFERARLELHQEIGPNVLLLGLLGREVAEGAPGMQPLTPPAEALDVPLSVNAAISPASGPAGLAFVAVGVGLPFGEPVTATVTLPDQRLYGDPRPVLVSLNGRSDEVSVATDSAAPHGIWMITFAEASGRRLATAYFRVW
jgi:hypothetical protein